MAEIKKKIIHDFATADSSPINTLRTICLFGNNVSTYKFALLSTLMRKESRSEIRYSDLRDDFVKELFSHYSQNPNQYTAGANSLTTAFDEYISSAKADSDWNMVLTRAEKLIYNNVFDAFHNVGDGSIAKEYILFEHDRKNKKLILTDNLNSALEDDALKQLIESENQGRWRAVEEAWKNKLSPNLLVYNEDGNLYSIRQNERVFLRSAVSVLLPYQHGNCFYCKKTINVSAHKGEDSFPDVDHFLPLSFLVRFNIQPVNSNGIWNLVIACKECNRGAWGKFAEPPSENYFKDLFDRNVLFVEEHKHSLKNSILLSLNANNSAEVRERMHTLYSMFRHITGWQPKIIYN